LIEASLFSFSSSRVSPDDLPAVSGTQYYAITLQIVFDVFGFPEAMLEGEGVEDCAIDDDGAVLGRGEAEFLYQLPF
jgi:hypothetical protein